MKVIGLVILLLMSVNTWSEVYKWVDKNGRVHYGDNPNTSAKTTVIEGKSTSYNSVPINRQGSNKVKAAKKQKVTMYSTSWCGYCKKARKYFTSQGIPFVDYDIEKNARARREYDKLGGRGVPVIVVGKRKMNGFSKGGFDRFYGS